MIYVVPGHSPAKGTFVCGCFMKIQFSLILRTKTCSLPTHKPPFIMLCFVWFCVNFNVFNLIFMNGQPANQPFDLAKCSKKTQQANATHHHLQFFMFLTKCLCVCESVRNVHHRVHYMKHLSQVKQIKTFFSSKYQQMAPTKLDHLRVRFFIFICGSGCCCQSLLLWER